MDTRRLSRFDWAILLGLPLIATAIGRTIALHENLMMWMAKYERWDIDEIAVMPIFLSIALIIVLARHVRTLHRAAHVDLLTGLPNRRAFLDALEERRDHGFTMLFLDLDGFKEVNDRYGHRQGDRLLREAAQRLRTALPADAIVSRFGGDEFCVLLPAIESSEPALAYADRIAAELARPPAIAAGTGSAVTASIGIVISQGGCPANSDPVRDADMAMYAAKRSGKAHAVVFRNEMRPRALNGAAQFSTAAG